MRCDFFISAVGFATCGHFRIFVIRFKVKQFMARKTNNYHYSRI